MTGGELLTLGKAVMFFALPLAFGIWELVKLRRDRGTTTPEHEQPGPREP